VYAAAEGMHHTAIMAIIMTMDAFVFTVAR